MPNHFETYLLQITGASSFKEVDHIQSLWSGYGKISRYKLNHAERKTVVVKCISLQPVEQHPIGWNTSLSHKRKIQSYEVETQWYKDWNHHVGLACKTPDFLGSFKERNEQWIVLEDLDLQYPLRKHHLQFEEVKVCLSWLAHFHATFLQQTPKGLWEIGTYWHLATRPEEFEKIKNTALKAKAHQIDALLNQCRYQTIVHGDAKLANFCFSKDSKKVAAVDFQYVGGGCGMKDVAYFLGSCLSSSECETHEQEALDFYFSTLKSALDPDINFKNLEAEWREMYPLACVDFTRFLLGWMPSHQKVNEYNLKMVERVLKEI